MKKNLVVAKFGGTSVADADQFRKIRKILQSGPERKIIVVSAPGKRFSEDIKVTDLLISCYEKAARGESFAGELEQIRNRFRDILEGLDMIFPLEEEIRTIQQSLETDPQLDYTVSRGEYLTARIMAEYLGFTFVDPAWCICFDEDGQLNANMTQRTMRASLLPLQQAFDDWKQTHLRDDVSVTAEDGAELRGGLYDAGSGVTVVMLHSFDGSSAASDYLLAPYFTEKGCNIRLPDSRDHGESGGDHVTYGLLEGSDTAAWVRFLLERYGPDHRVILQGADLGANAALTGAALLQGDPDTAGAVAFAAVRAPIGNLYDEANFLLKKQFGIPGVVVSLADRYARASLGGHSMGDVSLEDLTAGCTVPILVIRETGDTVIDPAGAKTFSEAYAGPCTVLELASAHGMGYAENTAACETALDDMIAACLDGQG